MIQPIQVIALIVACVHMARVLVLWKRNKLEGKTALFWFLIWAAVLIIAFATPLVNKLSILIGVGRSIDLAMYIALLVLFYLVFQLNMKVSKLEKEITRLVREIALKK